MVLAVLVAIGGLIGSWLDNREQPPETEQALFRGSTPISTDRFDEIKMLAQSACQCSLNNPGAAGSDCWSNYTDAIKDIGAATEATACAPVSQSRQCFVVGGRSECIELGFYVAEHDTMVCTKNDARAIEAAWTTAYEKVEGDLGQDHPQFSDRAFSAADAAVREALARIRRGEEIASIEPTGGCAG